MLAHAMRLPSTAFHIARRTTSLSTVVVGEVMATVFPNLAMPVDRIAVEAWAMGHYSGEAAVPTPAATRRARTS